MRPIFIDRLCHREGDRRARGSAYAGIVVLFRNQVGAGAPTLAGDVVMVVSSLILAERTVYLARAAHHLDHVKLLLAQAVIGTPIFLIASLLLERRTLPATVDPITPGCGGGWLLYFRRCRAPRRNHS